MFPEPDASLQALLDELNAYTSYKLGDQPKQPPPDLLTRIGRLGSAAALPYLLPWTHNPAPDLRLEAERSVAELLPTVSADHLIELEALLRESWIKFCSHGHDFRAALNASWKLSTLSPSGWRREAALLQLAKAKDPSALLYVLLRLNDWVGEVRKAAERWVAHCGDNLPMAQILECIPVLAALQERRQGSSSRFVRFLVGRLKTEEALPGLLDKLPSLKSARARRLVFCLLLESGALHQPEVQDRLLQQPNPVFAVTLLHHLRKHDGEVPDSLVHAALASKSAAVRRAGLYGLSAAGVQRFVPQLWQAAFDLSQGLRQFAQYHLLQSVPAAELQTRYLTRLQEERNSSATLVAILGFHECRGIWEVPTYERWSQHPSSRVRAAVMRSFATHHFDAALSWVRAEISSAKSSATARTALAILVKHPYAVTLDEIQGWLHPSQPAVVRQRGWAILSHRGKWERLPLLLRLSHDTDESIRKRGLSGLDAWLCGFNHSQIQPTQQQTAAAVAELSLCKGLVEQRLLGEFQALLATLRMG